MNDSGDIINGVLGSYCILIAFVNMRRHLLETRFILVVLSLRSKDR